MTYSRQIQNKLDFNNQEEDITVTSCQINNMYTSKIRYEQHQNEPQQCQLQANRSMTLTSFTTLKEMQFSDHSNYGLFLTSDSIQIVDLIYCEIIKVIHKYSYPRYIRLAKSGAFFLAYFADNTVSLFDIPHGREIYKIIGVPNMTNIFLLSNNNQKLLFGNNQTICLWSISKATIEMMTRQWKNVHCYAIHQDGNKFALGTYTGKILVETIIDQNRCNEFEINKHSKCIMCLSFQKDNIISICYDKILLTSIIGFNSKGQKTIGFLHQIQLESIPKSIEICNQQIFLIENNAVFWFINQSMLKGFKKGIYAVMKNQQGQTLMAKYQKGVINWFSLTNQQLKSK